MDFGCCVCGCLLGWLFGGLAAVGVLFGLLYEVVVCCGCIWFLLVCTWQVFCLIWFYVCGDLVVFADTLVVLLFA